MAVRDQVGQLAVVTHTGGCAGGVFVSKAAGADRAQRDGLACG